MCGNHLHAETLIAPSLPRAGWHRASERQSNSVHDDEAEDAEKDDEDEENKKRKKHMVMETKKKKNTKLKLMLKSWS